MPRITQPNIRDWRPADGKEPSLRVGVILDEDQDTDLRLDLPDAPFELRQEGWPVEHLRATAITFRLAGSAVGLRVGQGEERLSQKWELITPPGKALEPGSGAIARGVVAGRGFHWQKRVDQHLSGRLELRGGSRGLILVNELPLEAYLAGVITSEMSGACPGDLLKAQCVVARSWLLAFSEPKHAHEPFDRCNDDCCQRYQGTAALTQAALDAVTGTRGVVLMDDRGGVVDANYSKSCGGISEAPEYIWGRSKPGLAPIVDAPPGAPEQSFLPVTDATLAEYLNGAWLQHARAYCSPASVPDSSLAKYLGRVDETGSYFRWTVSSSREELEDVLRRKRPQVADLGRLLDIVVRRRGASGRAVEADVVYEDVSGSRKTLRLLSEYEIRESLHSGFLYSSAFIVNIERDAQGYPRTIALRGAGWGHGAGLCQIGALGMSLQGIGWERIVTHYFPAARLSKVYD